MLSQLLILSFALVLLFYWFRYNCHTLLRTAATGERARRVAEANELRFPYVLEQLQTQFPAVDLETLDRLLLRDFDVLTCLLRYTSGMRLRDQTVALRILMLDFKLQQKWFALTRKHLTGAARKSIEERSYILAHFANTMSTRSAAVSRA
ncbi:MAG: hypothetical protein ACLQGV_19360 [Bryobacteraceae bacterium]